MINLQTPAPSIPDNPLSPILESIEHYGVVPVLIALLAVGALIVWRQISWERTERLKEGNRMAEREHAIDQAIAAERATLQQTLNARFDFERQIMQEQIGRLERELERERKECAQEIARLQKQIDEKQDK